MGLHGDRKTFMSIRDDLEHDSNFMGIKFGAMNSQNSYDYSEKEIDKMIDKTI